jgi:hypothetical protein
MSKRRKKMTTEECIKVNMVSNFGPAFARKWGEPRCETCRAFAAALRDALVKHYLSLTIDERDTLGTRHLVAEPAAFEVILGAVWMIDAVRGLACETLPPCLSCGYQPVNQDSEPDDEAAP